MPATGIVLQTQEANEGVAALKHASGSAAGKAFDGDGHDSEEQGDEGFDEEDEEEDEDAALGSPMKKDAAGRTPRRNSIEFLQVMRSRRLSRLWCAFSLLRDSTAIQFVSEMRLISQDKSRRHITFRCDFLLVIPQPLSPVIARLTCVHLRTALFKA